jgi:2-oxo-4-hydroxy-4-carboxy-5-ureidoimidazoline decarboxylase
MTVDAFNALPHEEADERLTSCLSVGRWVDRVRDGRPYAGWQALEAAARDAAAQLSDDELARALAGHPRIGEQATGPHHQVELSRSEQSGVDPSDAAVRNALAEGNAAYEERFERVFLIRAAGRSAPEILGELRRRLGNDEATEREETVTQLREIALLRLRQVVS